MANVWNDYASKYTGVLDQGITQDAKTGMFVDADFKARFVGTKNVIIPSLDMVGMGNYIRVGNGLVGEGYAKGQSVISYDTYTMAMDRSRQLPFDAMDADESGVNNLIAQVTGSYKSQHIVPEVDAYNLSKLFAYSESKGNASAVVTSSEEGKVATVNKFIETITDAEESTGFNGEEMVAFVDKVFWSSLANSEKFSNQITVSDFKQGSINTKVKDFNGVKLIVVDSSRMKTKFEFDAGTSPDMGGFAPADDAKSLRALILPRNAAKFVKKLDELKVFTPKENQDGNAWIVDFHIYYDLFVLKSKEKSIFALYE